MHIDAVAETCRRLAQSMPGVKTELHYTNPYTLLVAVTLSAQATDVGVNKATRLLFQKVTTPSDMLALGLDGLKQHIKTIGLYNTKAKNLMAMAEILIAQHQGQVPNSREDLENLPGVGRKTANVVLNAAFGEATIAVDTHIFRVSNRTGLAPGKTVLAVEQSLMARIPEKYQKSAHYWLILHGRYQCTARKPLCGDCIIADLCGYGDKTSHTRPIKSLVNSHRYR